MFLRMVVMSDNQIVADGSTMEILENEALLNTHGLENRDKNK
jgi:energy-coupling factor transporter ATP-binding protein EcfA2